MNVTYEHKPAMTFIGYFTAIRPEEGYQKCPEFWDREYARKYARLWQTMKPETPGEQAVQIEICFPIRAGRREYSRRPSCLLKNGRLSYIMGEYSIETG